MKVVKQLFVIVAIILQGVELVASTPTCELVLDTNVEINVHAGETNEIYVLSGGAYTLTKKGLGVLKITDIASSDVKINVQSGELHVGDVPSWPKVMLSSVLHLDANNESSMTLRTEGEETYVDAWSDSNSSANYASAEKRVAPKLVRNFRNGLNIVDFGTIKNNKVDDGYGASMTLKEQITGVRETFSVMMYTEDVYAADGQATPIFGQSGQAAFLASSMGANEWPVFFSYMNPNTLQSRGGLYINGVNVPDNTKASGLLQLVSFRLAEPKEGSSDLALIDGLAYDRYFAYGGQRIAETILFNRALTDEERKEVNLYLNAKWFPSGAWSVSQITLSDDARLTISGNSTLSAADISAQNGDFIIDAATVSIDPLTTRASWFHVDANKIDPSDVEGDFLLKWKDVSGNQRYAKHSTLKFPWRNDPENRKPILRNNFLNGNSIVDFGSLQSPQIVDSEGAGVGYGAAMEWSETCSNVREVLMIVSETEDVPAVKEIYPNVVVPSPFVGNSSSSGNQFYRPNFTAAGIYPGVILANNPNTSHVWDYEHGVSIDGVEVSATSSMGSGFHLLNFRSSVEAKANYFAYDRGFVCGGLRYGEFLLFERELEECERNRLTGALMAKWLNGDGYAQVYSNVSVLAGGILNMEYAKLNITGTLKLDGRINAKSLRAQIIEPSPGASIGGVLDLTAACALALTKEAYGTRAPGEKFLVLEANVISGNPKRWKATGDLAGADQEVVLFVENGAIYAEVRFKKGLFIKVL